MGGHGNFVTSTNGEPAEPQVRDEHLRAAEERAAERFAAADLRTEPLEELRRQCVPSYAQRLAEGWAPLQAPGCAPPEMLAPGAVPTLEALEYGDSGQHFFTGPATGAWELLALRPSVLGVVIGQAQRQLEDIYTVFLE